MFWIDFELWFWTRRSCVIWEQAGALYNLMNVDKYLVQATPPFKSKNIFPKKYFHKSQVLLGGPIICSSSAVNIYQLTKIKDHFKMLWHFAYLIFVTYPTYDIGVKKFSGVKNTIIQRKKDCFEQSWTHHMISLSFTHSVKFTINVNITHSAYYICNFTPRVKISSGLAILLRGNLRVNF